MKDRTSARSLRLLVFFLFAFVFCTLCSAPLIGAAPGSTQEAPPASGPQGPKIWLGDSQALPVNPQGGAGMAAPLISGQAQPLSMISADVDGDGIADLVVGYSTPNGGAIAVYRGNLDAFAPQSDESFQAIGRGEFPSPFLPDAQTFSVPVSPAFLATGDFSGQGHIDLAFAAKGGSTLYIYNGDGKGGFTPGATINLTGGVTALAADQFGGMHLALIVGVSSGKQSFLAIYGIGAQGLTPIAAVPVSGPVTNLLFGNFGDPGPDAAFLSGGQVQILRSNTMKTVTVSVPGSAVAFALGSFIWDRNHGAQIAVLGADGSVQIVVRSDVDPRVYTVAELSAIRQATLNHQQPPAFVPTQSFPGSGWKIVESFPALSTVTAGQTPVFFRTRVSSNGADDVMWLSAASGQMVLISHPDAQPGAQSFLPGQVSVKPYNGSPLAALPIRTNIDGRPGIVALHQGQIGLSATHPLPDPTFTVNTTTDLVSANPNACLNAVAGQCSLREAIIEANATAGTDTIMIPAGTYTLTIARNGGDHHTSKTGTLEVQDSVNIVGAGQNSVIIQGGTVGVPGTPNGVDKVISFNQDIDSFTNATVSISNFTIQNGFNRGNTTITDGWGGAFDFDTGTSGNNTLTVTNVTLNNNTLTDGEGGGFAIFNSNNGTGRATFSNCIVQDNIIAPSAPNNNTANGGGGFVASPANMTMTNCTLSGNQANSGNGINPVGGGLEMLLSQAGTPTVLLHHTTITGNSAAGHGGGIVNTTALTIDQGSIISNNSAGSGNGGGNTDGGGMWFNAGTGHDGSISKSTFTGNSASNGSGGGIFVNGTAGGALTIQFSRFAGNTAKAGSNLANASGTVTATDNWWGTNSPAPTITVGSPAVTFSPFIVLTHTANPTLIRIGDPSNLTADFVHDSVGGTIAAASLDVFAGLPVTFDNANHGTISNAQPFIESQVNISTVSEIGCSSPPAVPCTATVTVNTSTPHGFSVGQNVTIAGVTDFTYDGVFSIASTPTATSFTYSTSNTNTTSSTGGTASVPAGTATALYTATSGGIDNVHATVDGFAATATITVLFPPSIAKNFDKTVIPVFTFSPVVSTLTFTITNPNTANALHGLAFTDNLPSGLAVANVPNVTNTCTGTVTATAGSGTISLSGGTVTFNGGGTATCTVSVDVKGVTDGVQNNTSGNVTATDAGGLTGNFATASITVIDPPTSAKAFGASTIPLNGTTSLTITVSSANANLTLGNISFTDGLPAGLVVATPNGLSSTCTGTATAVAGSGSVSLAGASLAPGTQCTVTANVQGTTAGPKSNSVTASDAVAGAGNTATASITVVAPPTINKGFGASSIPLNGTTTVTFTIANTNTTAAGDLTGVAFSDTLPITSGSGTATLVVAATPGVVNTCNGTVTATAGTGVISLSGGTVAHGASCTLTVNVTGTVAGAANNTTGAISSTQGGTGTTSNTVLLTVVAPPTISKAFGATAIPVNGTTTVTFTITNPAANTTSETGIAFSDTLTGGLQVSATPGSNSCGGTVTATAGSTSISLTGGSIATPGATCTVVVNVTGTLSGTVTNTTSAVSSTNGGTGATSNTATLIVASPATVIKSFAPTKIPLNGTSVLTINITNPNSGISLTGLSFTDGMPGGLVIAATPNLSNTCGGTATATAGSGTLSLSGGTVAASASCAVSVNVTGTVAGDKINSVTVSSTEAGASAPASATLTVVAPPTIAKAFNPTSIPLNGTSTVTFTITNPNNPGTPANGDLTGVAFSDTLPVSSGAGTATLVVAATPGVVNTCNGTVTATAGSGVISLSGGTVAHNSTCTLSVNVTGTVAGTGNNITGAISSTEGGTGTTSNTAPLTVVAPPTISKAFGAPDITLGGTTTVTFTITNPAANTSPENGIAFSDTLTNGLQVASPPGVSNSCSGTVTAAANTTSISLSGGSIATPGATCTIVVNVTGTQSGTVTNTTGAVSSTNGGTGATSNTATLIVASPANVNKNFGALQIPLNGTTSLTISITNPNSNVSLTGLSFTDSLPAGLVIASTPNLNNTCGGTATAVGGSGALSLSGGTLASSASCAVSVNVQGTTAGVKNNSVTVTSTEGGASAPATATLTVVGPPTLNKAFGATSIPLNGSTSLTFNIANPNGTSLSGIAFSDTLPAGLIISTPNGQSGTCTGTITGTAGTNTISLSGGSLAASGSCTISVNVTGTAAGHQVNTTGAITSTEGGTGGTASAAIDVVAPPSIAKAFNPTTIIPGGTSALSFTISNPGANTVAENGVAFSDTLPSGLVIATPNGLAGNCNGGTVTAVAGAGSISLTGGTVPVGASCVISVNVTGSTPGVFTNTTGAVSSTNGGTGNTASATLTVASPPNIAKAFGAATIPQNGTTSLTFTISNPNNSVAFTGLAFTDSFPAGIVVASTPNPSNTCGGTFTTTGAAGSVTLTGGSLGANASCTASVTIQGTTPGVKNNSVVASSNEGGTGPAGTATITVVAAPSIVKAFGAGSIPLNGSTSLSFTITNPNTTVALNGVAFSDTLPAGLIISTPNGLSGSCGGTVTATAGTNSITLSGGTIATGGSCSFSVNVTGTAAGQQNNTTGAVSSTNGGTGNTGTASVTVVAPPSIAKAFNPATIAPGTPSTLSFTITNPAANTVAENGVAFTDTLPSGLVVATPNNLTGNCNGGTVTAVAGSGSITLTGGTIPAASNCVISVDVTGSTPGTFTNTTGAVSSTNGGTGNTATAVLNIKHAALAITKTHQGTFHRGQNGAQYFLTISNSASAGPTVGTVTVVDTLPNNANPHNLVPVSLTGTGWTCTLSTLTCTRSDVLAPGASYPVITFTVNIPQNIVNSFTNTATVSGGGDPNSHTASDPVTLGPPLIISSTDSGSASVPSGNAAIFNFQVDATAVNPQPPVVSFNCTGLPGGSACIFSPLATGQDVLPFTMTVTTLPHSSSLMPSINRRGPVYATLFFPVFGVLVIGLGRARNGKNWLRLALAFGLIIALLGLAGCGGAPRGIQTFTNTGTFNITVTGTADTPAGPVQGSATVTLTVQ